MNPAPEPLPNDVAALRAMLVAAWAERDAERPKGAAEKATSSPARMTGFAI